MKIVYAADNRLGAAHQITDFIIHSPYDVKVAAYPKSGRFLPYINWNLAAVKNNTKIFTQLKEDIKNYKPDLIIIDAEPLTATIAFQLEIPIIYCSPLHLLDGLQWSKGYRNYSATLTAVRQKLMKLPPGVAKFIYSPWGDFSDSFSLKDGFEWLQPYHLKCEEKCSANSALAIIDDPIRNEKFKNIFNHCEINIFSDSVFSDYYQNYLEQSQYLLIEGQTKHLADVLYNQKKPIIVPDMKDAEMILNGLLCHNLMIGTNLDQIELMGREAVNEIHQILSSSSDDKYYQLHFRKQLHERINELWECT